jgi:hypothetical protein
MFDLTSEQPISLAEAAALVPSSRGCERTATSTLFRWITVGARARHGGIVKLDGMRLGGRWVTSREALQRFAERLSAESPQEVASAV